MASGNHGNQYGGRGGEDRGCGRGTGRGWGTRGIMTIDSSMNSDTKCH